jgi:hypothetical protein
MRACSRTRPLAFAVGAAISQVAFGAWALTAMVPAPRVALLFTTRGSMPLEDIWSAFLHGVEDQRPPLVSPAEFDLLMGEYQLADVQRRVQMAGRTDPSLRFQTASCVSWSSVEV